MVASISSFLGIHRTDIMAMPSVAQVFESSLLGSNMHLENMIRDQLEHAHQEVSLNLECQADLDPGNPTRVLTELGDYLSRTAVLWSVLTHNLVSGQQLESVIQNLGKELHENARTTANLSDLTATAALDVNVTRLRCVPQNSAHHLHKIEPNLTSPSGK